MFLLDGLLTVISMSLHSIAMALVCGKRGIFFFKALFSKNIKVQKKPQENLLAFSGGTDGTRTRDLRRDRAAL